PASEFGIKSQFDVPDEVFMARELIPGTLNKINGTASYHPAFDGV
ncbi:MAG: N-acetyltransferase, partial [Gammaproteobacteria bacterium]|nr:N-acetyltransferase [Gammaproteobacteria bacterium]